MGWNSTPLASDSDDPQILPLCPALVVPSKTRLECCIKAAALDCRQEIAFDVVKLPEKGGDPLARVCISEAWSNNPGVYLKTVNGQEELAFLSSTAEFWDDDLSPVLSIQR